MPNRRILLLVLLDGVWFALALLGAFTLRENYTFGIFDRQALVVLSPTHAVQFTLYGVAYLFLCYSTGLYEDTFRWSSRQHGLRIMAISAMLFAFVTVVLYLTNPFTFPRSNIILFLLFNAIGQIILRVLVLRLLWPDRPRRVILIGRNAKSFRILKELRRQKSFRARILGVLDESDRVARRKHYVYKVLGTWKDANPLLGSLKPDLVLMSVQDLAQREAIISSLDSQILAGTFLYADPDFYEIMIGRPTYLRIGDMPFIRIRKSIARAYGPKRLIDFGLALALVTVTGPLLAALALAVKLSSPGRAIFTQERVGRYEKPFRIFKFRTMHEHAEKDLSKVKSQDPRVTPLGAWMRSTRLDELPQLLNILRGEMSFIGPRPLIQKEVEACKRTVPGFSERFIALPGITGLAQVHGDYYTLPDEKIKYDLWYCYHYNLFLDLTISLRTIKTVFLRKGT